MVRAIAPEAPARRDLERRLGLAPLLAEGPLGDDVAHRLWDLAAQVSEDDALGLHLASHSTMEDLAILGYLARASATFGAACSRAVQFERLLKNNAVVAIEPDPAGVRLVDSPVPGRARWPRHLAEAILALWWLWPRRWAEVRCAPLRVRFQHERPACTADHARLFGCPVEFGQARNELLISQAVWALPLPSADPLLGRYLEPVAEDELQVLLAEDPLLRQLRDRLLEMLPSGQASAARLARAVGLSRRTLHRRLRERGTTYEALLDDLRRRTALRLLDGRAHTLMEVAFLVGYSEASSLRRALRRWSRQSGGGQAEESVTPCSETQANAQRVFVK